MKKNRKRDCGPKSYRSVGFAPGISVWVPLAMLVLVLGGVAVWAGAKNRAAEGPKTNPTPRSPVVTPAVPAGMRNPLIGRWLRPDGGYVLAIDKVGEDGQVVATYANPRPINVSKAQVVSRDGHIALFVELRDRGYPGSYYMLIYDAGRDQLAGEYHHLGLGQTFEVGFERMGREASANQ